MSLLSSQELKDLERKFADGVRSSDILSTFQRKNQRLSEATLRKYVQLGLLPRSTRVGTKGRHSGSIGMYPVSALRQINDIKKGLSEGATLESLTTSRSVVDGQLQEVEGLLAKVFGKVEQAVKAVGSEERGSWALRLKDAKRGLDAQLGALSQLVGQLNKVSWDREKTDS